MIRNNITRKMGGGGGKLSFLVYIVIAAILIACTDSSSSSSGGGSDPTPPTPTTLGSVSDLSITSVADNGSLELSWEAPVAADSVVITASPVGTTGQSFSVTVPAQEYKELFLGRLKYELKGLKEHTAYTIEVEAQSGSQKSSKVSQEIITAADTTAPQDGFFHVGVEKAGDNQLKVVWDTKRLGKGKTDISKAEVQIENASGEVVAKKEITNIESGELAFSVATSSNVRYDVKIVYEDINGNKASIKEELTDIDPSKLGEAVPALQASNVKVEAKDKTGAAADESLLITWGNYDVSGEVELLVVVETSTGQVVADARVTKNSVAQVANATEEKGMLYVGQNGVAVTKLYGVQSYKAIVRPYKNGRYYTAVEKEGTTTDKQTETVTNVGVVAGQTRVIVSWQAPQVGDYAGVKITVMQGITVVKTETIRSSSVRNAEITGLEAATKYKVKVVSLDSADNEGAAAEKEVTTLTNADTEAPDAVGSITSKVVLSGGKKALRIEWGAPNTILAKNQDIKEYLVSVAEKEAPNTEVLPSTAVKYPATRFYKEIASLESGKTYEVKILSKDYAGNESEKTAEVTVPAALAAPSKDGVEGITLDKSGAIRAKVAFKTGPGSSIYYRVRMNEGATVVAEKSITGSTKEVYFGIADGLEVASTEGTAKEYGFFLVEIKGGQVSPATDIASTKLKVWDSVSTAPPMPSGATLKEAQSFKGIYEFSIGTFGASYKTPAGTELSQSQVEYRVYIAEGDHSTLDEIQAESGVRSRVVQGSNSATKHSITFAGEDKKTYTVGVAAINTLNSTKVASGTAGTIKKLTMEGVQAVPPAQSLVNDILAVSKSLTREGTIKIEVTELTAFTNAIDASGNPITNNDGLVYTVYGLQKDTNPANAQEVVSNGRKVAIGSASGGKYTQDGVDKLGLTSETPKVQIAIKGKAQYHFVVEVAVKTDTTKKVYGAVESVTTGSQAKAPLQIAINPLLTVEETNPIPTGTIDLELTELTNFASAQAKDDTGTAITSNAGLVYTVYGLQKDTNPANAQEVVSNGRKVAIGSARDGKYTVSGLSKLGLTTDAGGQIDIVERKQYHFVVEVAIKTDVTKKVVGTIKTVVLSSKAVAPAQSLVNDILVVGTSTTVGAVKVDLTVLTQFTNAKDDVGVDITSNAGLIYTVYGLQKTGTAPSIQDIVNNNKKVALGAVSGGKYTINALTTLGASPSVETIKGNRDYYFVAEVAVKTDTTKKVYSTVETVKTASKAVAPQQSSVNDILAVSKSTTVGEVKLEVTVLTSFTGLKADTGAAINDNTGLSYTVYGLQKDTTPTKNEVLAGRKVAIGTVSAGKYTVNSLDKLGLTTDSSAQVGILGNKQYHFVVEVAVATDMTKKVVGNVESVTTDSEAVAPSAGALSGNFSMEQSSSTGAVKLTLRRLTSFTGLKADTGAAINDNTGLSYTVYGLQKDTNPANAQEVVSNGRKVAIGSASGANTAGVYTVEALDKLGLTSDSAAQVSLVAGKQYHFVAEVAVATDKTKKVLSTIESITVSPAVPPKQSLVNNILSLGQSSAVEKLKLELTQLTQFTNAKDSTGQTITDNSNLVYTVYGLQKDTNPANVQEIVSNGRKVAIGTVSGGKYTVEALDKLGLTSDSAAQIDLDGGKKYHFVAEVAIARVPEKRVYSTVQRITVSQAVAPQQSLVTDILTVRSDPSVNRGGIVVNVTLLTTFTGAKKFDGSNVTANADLEYNAYLLKDTGSIPTAAEVHTGGTEISLSKLVQGVSLFANTFTFTVQSETKYHFVVEVVIKSDTAKTVYSSVKAITSTKISSEAIAPPKVLLDNKLAVSQSSPIGAIKLVLTQLSEFAHGSGLDRVYTQTRGGDNINDNKELVYIVFGLQQDTVPTAQEVIDKGSEIVLPALSGSTVKGGKYTLNALSTVGGASIKGKRYHFVFQIAVKTDLDAKVVSDVESILVDTLVPTEVNAITFTSISGGANGTATVQWDAPTLGNNYKNKAGTALQASQVSYKVYHAEKGATARTVAQIKAADSSPMTIGANVKTAGLTSLKAGVNYEVVVQAVNSTDTTKMSDGKRAEFKTAQGAAPNTPTVALEANGNTIEVDVTAPSFKGTKTDGTGLTEDELSYTLYYYASTSTLTAAQVKTQAQAEQAKGSNQDAKVGGVKTDVTSKAIYVLGNLNKGQKYFITVEAVNSIVNNRSIPTSAESVTTATFTIELQNSNSTYTVGTAITPITITKDPGNATFSCTIDALAKETGLQFSVRDGITGKPNKSNEHDPFIREYKYTLVCTGTGSHAGQQRRSITIQTGLQAVQGKAANYYRPTTKNALRDIIDAEVKAQGNAPNLNMIDTSAITDMEYLLYNQGSYTYQYLKPTKFNGNISNWNTSNVTTMSNMLVDAWVFNRDVSQWDTSNVTDMDGLFKANVKFDQDISGWNVSNVRSMSQMFYANADFNQDISDWDVSNVQDMSSMFLAADKFNQDISKWKVHNVSNMDRMFRLTKAFNQDISDWTIQANISYKDMFKEATAFDQNLSKWKICTYKASDTFDAMFTGSAMAGKTAQYPTKLDSSSNKDVCF